MNDPDEVNTNTHKVAMVATVVLAYPENLKAGFSDLIDRTIEETVGSIIDWGTARFASQRILDTRDGTEIIQIAMTVGLLVADDA